MGFKPRILSPINSFKGAVKVISAGADEVYCGVTIPEIKDFMLYRGASCEIPTYDELGKVVKHAHNYGVKVVVTVNRPFMSEVIEKATRKHIRLCLDEGIDGLIVGNIGVLLMIQDMDVDTELYASTYMVSMNYEAVDFLGKLGFSRVVLDRQLRVAEISEIVQRSKVEIEVFIHGGGCSNTNGNCYLYHFRFPEMIRTAQLDEGLLKSPCTLSYDVYDQDDGHKKLGAIPIMDAFEVCSLCKLPELLKTGVFGFKIEGRGDCIWFQESETRVYRELIDLLMRDKEKLYQEKIELLKSHLRKFILHPTLPSLREFFCEQKRCYYSPLFHTPYKYSISWQAWTKERLMYWRVE